MAKTKWVAFLRGVNVGGNNKLPMKQLKQHLEANRFTEVATYIQSGNIVFAASSGRRDHVAKEIRDLIAEHFGFSPEVLLLKASELNAIREANPFPDAEPARVHCLLTLKSFTVDDAAVEALRAKSEQTGFVDKAAFLFAPDGIGRSKLAAKLESLLGVAGTGRNMRTLNQVASLAGDES